MVGPKRQTVLYVLGRVLSQRHGRKNERRCGHFAQVTRHTGDGLEKVHPSSTMFSGERVTLFRLGHG